MNAESSYSTADRNGLPVETGTRVRVVCISSSILDHLETPERERVQSMIGEIFEVYEVDDRGGAWVEKWWHEPDDNASSHSLCLNPSEMEVSANDV